MNSNAGSVLAAVVALAAFGLMIYGYMWIMRRQSAQLRADIRAMAVPASLIPGAGSGLMFRCAHLSIGNVDSASCETCGPLDAAA